jgi:hypothetical protein
VPDPVAPGLDPYHRYGAPGYGAGYPVSPYAIPMPGFGGLGFLW